MKKILIAALAALTTLMSAASPVDVTRAKTAATNFMKSRLGGTATVKEVVSQSGGYYVFNMSPAGWVIVSADDSADPILAYNTGTTLRWHSMPESMTYLLGQYDTQIKQLSRLAGDKKAIGWTRLNGMATLLTDDASGKVEPLIKVHWDQASPFNKYTPKNGNRTSLVGCVAVAMSQAMSVQRYPSRPTGNASFTAPEFGYLTLDFDAQTPYDWEAIIRGDNNYDNAARLLRDAGYSVEMGYGESGSGIPSNEVYRISNALINTFQYGPNDVKYYWRSSYTKDWEALILSELQAGRAVVYNAIDTQGGYGHSFNVDGYDNNRYFHLNWGWGSVGDGYFRLDALRDAAMNMNYDDYHVAVVGIGSPDRVIRSLDLSEDVVDEGLPVGTLVGLLTVNGEEPLPTYKFTVRGAYQSGGTYQKVPFEVKDGGLLVTTETLKASADPLEVSVTIEDPASGERLTSSFNITICKLRSLGGASSLSMDRATGVIKVKTRANSTYTLTNAQGSRIASENLGTKPYFEFNRSQLSSGENTLVLTNGSETKTIKIKN